MVGTGAYAMPTNMPFVAKRPLKRKMSESARQHFDYLMSMDVDLFSDESTGELYAKVTDTKTGKSEIRKCVYTDED
ncbi:MAG: hypothetical protein IJS86_01325 [Lachnospiraceae bacterium]|nr:hypothetical protein [Lachnospiraceae bacterium]